MKRPSDMMSAVTASMREPTGRTLEQWVELVQASGPDPLDQKAVRGWRRAEHGVPQNSHRLGLATVEDVTAEVEALLRTAYDQNG